MQNRIIRVSKYMQKMLKGSAIGLCIPAVTALSFATGDALKHPSQPKWRPKLELEAKAGTRRHIGRAGMFVPLAQNAFHMLYGDLRFMADSRANQEGNFGLGYRFLDMERQLIWGLYGYFDRRSTNLGSKLNQFTVGTEVLSNTWEARFNVYIPKSKTEIKQSGYTGFKHFQNKETLMGGFDAEVGRSVPGISNLRFFLGGYHYSASGLPSMRGVQARTTYKMNDYFSLEGSINNDNIRNTNAYLGLKVSVSIGGSSRKKSRGLSDLELRMEDMPIRDVDAISLPSRNEEVGHYHDQIIEGMKAEDDTGDGSFENPFKSIKKAQQKIQELESQGIQINKIHTQDESGNIIKSRTSEEWKQVWQRAGSSVITTNAIVRALMKTQQNTGQDTQLIGGQNDAAHAEKYKSVMTELIQEKLKTAEQQNELQSLTIERLTQQIESLKKQRHNYQQQEKTSSKPGQNTSSSVPHEPQIRSLSMRSAEYHQEIEVLQAELNRHIEDNIAKQKQIAELESEREKFKALKSEDTQRAIELHVTASNIVSEGVNAALENINHVVYSGQQEKYEDASRIQTQEQLRQARKIEEAELKLRKAEEQKSQLDNEIQNLQNELNRVESIKKQIENQLQYKSVMEELHETHIKKLDVQLNKATNELQLKQEKLSVLDSAYKALTSQYESTQTELENSKTEYGKLAGAYKALEQTAQNKQAELEAEIARARELRTALNNSLRKLKRSFHKTTGRSYSECNTAVKSEINKTRIALTESAQALLSKITETVQERNRVTQQLDDMSGEINTQKERYVRELSEKTIAIKEAQNKAEELEASLKLQTESIGNTEQQFIAQIQKLNSEIKILETEAQELKAQNNSFAKQIEETHHAKTAAENQLASATNIIKLFTDRINSLSEESAADDSSLVNLNAEFGASADLVSQKIQKQIERIQSLEETEAALKSSIEAVYTKIQDLENQNTQLISEKKDIELASQKAQQEYSKLNQSQKDALQRLEKQLQKANQAKNHKDQHITKIAASLEDKKQAITQLQDELRTQEEEHRQVLAAIQKESGTEETAVYMTKIEKQKSAILRKKNEIQALNAKVTDLTVARDALTQDVSKKEDEIKALRNQIEASTKSNEYLLNQMTLKKDDLEAQLLTAKTQVETLNMTLIESKTKLEDITVALDQTEIQKTQALSEVQKLTDDNNTLQYTIEALAKEKHTQENRINELTKEIENLQSMAANERLNHSELSSKIDTLTLEKTNLEKKALQSTLFRELCDKVYTKTLDRLTQGVNEAEKNVDKLTVDNKNLQELNATLVKTAETDKGQAAEIAQNNKISIERNSELEKQIAELQEHAASLTQNLTQLQETQKINESAIQSLTTELESSKNDYKNSFALLQEQHVEQIESLAQQHKNDVESLAKRHELEVAKLQTDLNETVNASTEELNTLKAQHQQELSDLQIQYNKELEKLTQRYEAQFEEMSQVYESEQQEKQNSYEALMSQLKQESVQTAEQLKKVQSENLDLKHQVQELTNSKKEAQEELENLRSEFSEQEKLYNTSIQNLTTQIALEQEDLINKENMLAELSDQLQHQTNESEEKIKELQEQKEDLKRAILEQQSQLQDLQSALVVQTEKAQKDAEEKAQQLQEAENKVNELTTMIVEKDTALESLSADFLMLQEAESSLLQALKSKEEELQQALQNQSTQENSYQEMTDAIRALNSQLTHELDQQKQANEQSVRELTEENTKYTRHVESLNTQIQQLETERTQIENKVNSLKAALSESQEAQKIIAEAQRQELDVLTCNYQQQLEQKQSEIDAATYAIEEIRQALQAKDLTPKKLNKKERKLQKKNTKDGRLLKLEQEWLEIEKMPEGDEKEKRKAEYKVSAEAVETILDARNKTLDILKQQQQEALKVVSQLKEKLTAQENSLQMAKEEQAALVLKHEAEILDLEKKRAEEISQKTLAIQAVSEALKKATDTLAERDTTIQNLSDEKSGLEQTLLQQTLQISLLDAEINMQANKISTLEKDLTDKTQVLEEQAKAIHIKTQQIDQTQKELLELKKELTISKETNQNVTEDSARLQEKLKAKEEDFIKLLNEKEEAEKTYKDLILNLNTTHESELTQRSEQLDKDLEELKTQLEQDFMLKITKITDEHQYEIDQLTHQKDQMGNLYAKHLATHEQEKENHKQEMLQLNQALEAIEEQILLKNEYYEAQIDKLNKYYNSENERLVKIYEDILIENNARYQERINLLTQQKEAAERELIELKEKVKLLSIDNEKLRQALATKESDLKSFNDKTESMKNQHNSAVKQLQANLSLKKESSKALLSERLGERKRASTSVIESAEQLESQTILESERRNTWNGGGKVESSNIQLIQRNLTKEFEKNGSKSSGVNKSPLKRLFASPSSSNKENEEVNNTSMLQTPNKRNEENGTPVSAVTLESCFLNTPGGNSASTLNSQFSQPGEPPAEIFNNTYTPGDNSASTLNSKFSKHGEPPAEIFNNTYTPGDNSASTLNSKFS